MPEPIWEAIKWILIISCIGGWLLFLIEYLLHPTKGGKKGEE